MALVGDMVVQTANAPGTGTYNLIPVAARATMVSQTGPGQVFYFSQDASSWEKGIGTVAAGSPDTLTRDTILGNSLGTTARINFSGAVTIFCDVPAERSLWANAAGDALLASNRRLSGLAQGSDVADAPRLDQLQWRQIGSRITIGTTPGYSAGIVNIFFGFPAGFERFRIEWDGVVAVNRGAIMISRMSFDGTNFTAGDSDYMQQTVQIVGSTVSGLQGDYSYIGITPPVALEEAAMGAITFLAQGDHSYELTSRALISGPSWWSQRSNGRIAVNRGLYAAGILLGMQNGFQYGTFRLLGAL